LKKRQTFFAFDFFVGQRLSEEALRIRFSGAFDYDSVFTTSSTFFWLFAISSMLNTSEATEHPFRLLGPIRRASPSEPGQAHFSGVYTNKKAPTDWLGLSRL